MSAVAEREPLKNHDAVKFIGWTALGYGWRIIASLMQIIFVWYIFSRTEDRFCANRQDRRRAGVSRTERCVARGSAQRAVGVSKRPARRPS
jgi:hypothetical protein